jgi:hypothetical protein
MPRHLPYFAERSTMAQHLRGECMAKQMSPFACRVHACMDEGALHDATDRTRVDDPVSARPPINARHGVAAARAFTNTSNINNLVKDSLDLF